MPISALQIQIKERNLVIKQDLQLKCLKAVILFQQDFSAVYQTFRVPAACMGSWWEWRSIHIEPAFSSNTENRKCLIRFIRNKVEKATIHTEKMLSQSMCVHMPSTCKSL